jgi:response regulator RpfG family c-di-GMP phosphodiesterase
MDNLKSEFCNKESSNILIIDDQENIRQAMKNMIISIMTDLNIQFHLIEGSDGKDLINYLKNAKIPIDLVFTDENMEFINGSEAIKKIRKNEKKQNLEKVSIISVTSDGESESKKKNIIDSGADCVLNKPLKKCDLKSTLLAFLR